LLKDTQPASTLDERGTFQLLVQGKIKPPDWGRMITQVSFPKSIPNTADILENDRPMSQGRSSFLRVGWIF
jgi:hypothetical protein